ncbi:MAG: acyltransferase [Candidimonas sp.]|nr:acyltransferase [Candidimonas sp.]
MSVISLFSSVVRLLPSLPFKRNLRNATLRSGIIRRIVGGVLTDDERAEYLGLPDGCRIREGAKIISPENLVIGEYCWIGENAVLDASGGLEIGAHTSIGISVFVWSHSSHLTNLSMDNSTGSDLIKRKKTKIGRGCFIAGPSVILPGVTIGDNVLIRPFSTVEHDVKSHSLVGPSGVKEGVFTEERVQRMISLHRKKI